MNKLFTNALKSSLIRQKTFKTGRGAFNFMNKTFTIGHKMFLSA